MRRLSLPSLQLVPTFALLSLVPFLALAVAMVFEQRADTRAHVAAAQEAGLAPRLAPVQRLAASAGGGRLAGPASAALDRALRPLRRRGASVRVLTRAGHSAYASSRRPLGSRTVERSAFRTALGGRSASTVTDGGLLRTYLPIRPEPGRRPTSAFEVTQPFERAAAAAAPGSPNLLLVLGLLAGAWGALVRLVAVASRRLRTESAQRRKETLSDPLTDLPNRTAFRDAVQRALPAGRRSGSVVAVMLMDLDRFKEINDTLGHYNGDLLLQRIGPRLRSVLRDQDTVARLSGDEFAVLMPGLPDREAVAGAAGRILRSLEEPFVLGGLALNIEASLGVALYPEHGSRVDALLQRADTAMYSAKEAHTGFEFFADEHDESAKRRLALVGELRRAIDEREIVLHYQPKASFQTGRVTGVEALARWENPKRGLLTPDEFVPLVEQTNLLTAFTEHVLDTALSQVRDWRRRGLEMSVAVNLSMRNLLDLNLVEHVGGALEKWSLPPEALELELTESTLMAEPRRVMDVLVRLRAMGVGLTIDDFGTGYSSLTYLKDLPVDKIKIDKSFVLGMGEEREHASIVRATIDLGHNLGLEVVAEGVETDAACQELSGLGCDYAQGFLLAKPAPASELTDRLAGLTLPLPPRLEAVPTAASA